MDPTRAGSLKESMIWVPITRDGFPIPNDIGTIVRRMIPAHHDWRREPGPTRLRENTFPIPFGLK